MESDPLCVNLSVVGLNGLQTVLFGRLLELYVAVYWSVTNRWRWITAMAVVPSDGNVLHISEIHVMLEFFCNSLLTEPCIFAISSDEVYVFHVRAWHSVSYLYDKQTNAHLYIFIHIYVCVASLNIILQQHVSIPSVTIIKASYNNNTINIKIIYINIR